MSELNEHYLNEDGEESCYECDREPQELYSYDDELYCEDCLVDKLSDEIAMYLINNELTVDDIVSVRDYLENEMNCYYDDYILDLIQEQTLLLLNNHEQLITNVNKVCHQNLEQLQKLGVDKFINAHIDSKYRIWATSTKRVVTLFYNHTKNGQLHIQRRR